MAEYLSPGVYVEETPSAVSPITGVGTSTAAFVAVFPKQFPLPPQAATQKSEILTVLAPDKKTYPLANYPVLEGIQTFTAKVNSLETKATLHNDDVTFKSSVIFAAEVPEKATIEIDYFAIPRLVIQDERTGVGDGKRKREFLLSAYPVDTNSVTLKIEGTEVNKASFDIVNRDKRAIVTYKEGQSPQPGKSVAVSYTAFGRMFSALEANTPAICTNFSEFKTKFGDFSGDSGQRALAHAVFGFFHNGGSRCFVMRVESDDTLKTGTAFAPLEAIDEISIVAVPGSSDAAIANQTLDHCKRMNRFAVLDDGNKSSSPPAVTASGGSSYGAFYYPRIQVFDPAEKALNPDSSGLIHVGACGHIAGIYARVDTERGVHKAPANEVVKGALGLELPISKAVQDLCNPKGINCIRAINGAVRVWGARTIGGDQNGEFKYVSTRRLMLFLHRSIEQGTQWVVFEPNNRALWQKIARNVTAFLTMVWRSGALFGDTQAEAFYVKCDDETNPPQVRDQGQVVTEIGVAIVRPAEFVIFRISQFSAPGG